MWVSRVNKEEVNEKTVKSQWKGVEKQIVGLEKTLEERAQGIPKM